MLDTVGPEIQVYNKGANPIELKADNHVTITSDINIEPSAEKLAVNYDRLAEVRISNWSYEYIAYVHREAWCGTSAVGMPT